MYALAFKFRNDTWLNLVTDELTNDLSLECLLPSVSVAKLALNEFGDVEEFDIVEANILTLSKSGVLQLEWDEPTSWQMDEDEDEMEEY